MAMANRTALERLLYRFGIGSAPATSGEAGNAVALASAPGKISVIKIFDKTAGEKNSNENGRTRMSGRDRPGFPIAGDAGGDARQWISFGTVSIIEGLSEKRSNQSARAGLPLRQSSSPKRRSM